MQYKKLYLIILLICLKLSVQAQGLSLIAPTLSATCNTTINVPVKIKNFQRLLSLQFSLGWDTSRLQLNGVNNYGPTAMALSNTNFGMGNSARGLLTFAWNNENQAGVSLTDSTSIFVLQFTVKGNNGTTGYLNFFGNPTNIEAIDIGLNSVPVTTVNGSVNVNCAVASPLYLVIPTVTDTCNSSVDVPVKVKNFQHLLSLQFSMSWDTSRLSYTGVSNYGPAALALSASNFGTAAASNGGLSFVWNDAALSPKNLSDSSILFYLRFNVRGNNGASAAVQFSSNPTVMEAIDSALNPATIINVDGSVKIICSQGIPVNIIAPMMVDTCKTTADVAIKVKNFVDLQSLQFSVRWDTARIKFASVIDYGIAALSNTASNFGTSDVNSGKLSYAWSDATALSKTLADSSTLFMIRFQLKGGIGKTDSLFIQNTPTSIEAIDKYFTSIPYTVSYKSVPVFCKTCPVATTKTTSLSGCNAVVYKGKAYTSSIVVRDTLLGYSGCDSIYNVATITVNKITLVTKNTNITGCKSVVYNTKTYTASTVISDTVRSYQGCDSIINNVNIIVSNITPSSNTINLSGCSSVVYKIKTYTTSTVLLDTTKSVYGCDSLYNTINITVYKITPVTSSNTISGCNSLVYNGKTYTTSTVITDTTKSVTGCDSLYFTHTLMVYKIVATTSSNNLSSCGSVTYKSVVYSANTSFIDTVKSINGCDSVYITVSINITPSPTRDTFATKCSSFLWYGTTFYNDTIAAHYVPNTVTNIFGQGFSGTTSITLPTGWTFSGTMGTYTTAGNFGVASPSLKFALNNDRIITPTLSGGATQIKFWLKSQAASGSSLLIEGFNGSSWVTVNNITSFPIVGTNITYTATSSPALPLGLIQFRFTYTKSVGNISFDDLNILYGSNGGCDSLIALHLTIKKATINTVNLSGCNNVTYKTKTYTSSAIVQDTIRNVQGCDSIINVANITVYKVTAVTNNINLSGCNAVLYKTVSYTSSTVIRDTVKSFSGCDSIYNVINIAVNKITPTTSNLSYSGCNSVVYKTKTYTTSTLVRDTVKSFQGCDSIFNVVTITVYKLTAVTNNLNYSGCNSVVYKAKTYTTSTVVRDTIKSVQACDSIYNIANITVYKVTAVTNTINLSGCNAVLYKTVSYTSSTVIRDTVKSFSGCDSIYNVINIAVNKITPTTSNLSYSGCNSVVYKTKTYTTSTLVRDTVKSFQGCDSIYNVVTITVNKITPATNNLSVSGCNSVVYNTKTYTTSTVVRDTIKSYQGCDSIYKVATITVNKITVANTSQSYIGCGSYTYNSIVYTSSATLKDTIKSYQGCDSIYRTTTITVVKATSNIINLSSCGSVTYKGNTYTSSTTLHDTIKGSLGCDSIYNTVNIVIGAGFDISGNVKHPTKGAIPKVTVNLTGTNAQSITSTGIYTLSCVSSNATGNIKVTKNNDVSKTNGVTTLDLALLQSHILQKNILNSPYKIIAGDVNGDGKVTTLDIVYIKRLILGLDTTYTKTSTGEKRMWVFVDSSFKFADSTIPFPYRDSISFNAINNNLSNKTFIGIKLGDVNFDWNTAIARPALIKEGETKPDMKLEEEIEQIEE